MAYKENNLPLPNAAEWELKTQRRGTSALLTLFHLEPSPRALHIADYLLSNYGWKHKDAGTKYPESEKSFRQTLSYKNPTARGFFVDIDNANKRVIVRFDPSKIDDECIVWKNSLAENGMIEYDKDYMPYWGFDDLYHKAGVKLGNCFYVSSKFLSGIRDGNIFIDFDARTSHNHGTKFRIKQNTIPLLYENVQHI